jgi:hypothetical protein
MKHAGAGWVHPRSLTQLLQLWGIHIEYAT